MRKVIYAMSVSLDGFIETTLFSVWSRLLVPPPAADAESWLDSQYSGLTQNEHLRTVYGVFEKLRPLYLAVNSGFCVSPIKSKKPSELETKMALLGIYKIERQVGSSGPKRDFHPPSYLFLSVEQ